MDALLGLLLLALALAAMFWLIRSWDVMREQFGARLQYLFGPQQSAEAAAADKAARKTLRERHLARLEARRQRTEAPARTPATRHHTPTARHH
jgi:phage baseplate assembly protein W